MRFAASYFMHRLSPFLLLALVFLACDNNVDPIVIDIDHDTTSTVLADYFPLSLGNQWSYSFHNFYRAPGGQVIDTTRGTSNWKIVSSTASNQDTSYLVEETVNGIWIHTYNYTFSSGVDTAFYVNAQFHFNIIDSASHRILVQLIPDTTSSPNDYLTSVFQSRVLYRYGDPAVLGDIITYGPNDYLLTVERRKGPTFFSKRQIGNGQTVYEANLTSYSVQ